MGLEPTRCNQHKILSLARLPIPTLPHLASINLSLANKCYYIRIESNVNIFLKII